MAFESLSLLDFIPAVSRDLTSPWHLSALAKVLEDVETRPVRAVSSVSTRHGKTTLIGHAIARLLRRNPKIEICYFTFSADFAGKKSREFRALATVAGVTLSKDHNTIQEWRTAEGGGLFACSVDQAAIGRGFHVVIVDDALGSAADADDLDIRDRTDAAIRFLATRIHPGGSMIVNASRFHPDDPNGRRPTWEQITAPAIRVVDGVEVALWPERWPIAELHRMRAELAVDDPAERTWFAQFMGDPKPEGANLFGQPTLWTELPTWGYRVAHGGDFAYTQSASADWFALVSGRIYGSKLYILDVRRERLDAVMLESSCKSLLSKYGQSPIWSYQSGPEIGLSKLLTQRGVPIGSMLARYNKLVRAQKTIRRWNDGEILVPADESLPWRAGFLRRVNLFRGHEKDQDDEVDALVSLGDAMMGGGHGSVGKLPGSQGSYTGMLG